MASERGGELGERDELDAFAALDVGVAGDDVHPERVRLGGDERADAAEPTSPRVRPASSIPVIAGHSPARARSRPRTSGRASAKQEGDRQLGDGVRVRAGRRRDGDAVAGGRGEVDAVEAGAVAGDDTEARRALEDGGAHLVEAGDQPVRVRHLGGERLRVERAGPVAHLADGALERAPQHGVVHAEGARRHHDDALGERRRSRTAAERSRGRGHALSAGTTAGPSGVRTTRRRKPVVSIVP